MRNSLKTISQLDDALSATRLEYALACIHGVSVDALDSKILTRLLSKVDETAFNLVEKATLKSEILKRAGFTNFNKIGTFADVFGFTNTDIAVVELENPITLYRRGYLGEPTSPNGLGRWYGDQCRTIEQVRNDLAVCEEWGNPLAGEYTITVPKGTKVLKGTAAPQTIKNATAEVIEYRAGGGVQYWLNDVLSGWLIN